MTLNRHHKYMSRGAGIRRTPFRTTKPKPGSKRAVRDELDSVDAQIVKMRDDFWCVQCKADGVPNQGILDGGHLYPKGKFPGGRFLLENIFAQCRFHNTVHVNRPEYFFNWYLTTHTQAELDALHVEALKPAPSLETMKTLLADREQELAVMRLCAAA